MSKQPLWWLISAGILSGLLAVYGSTESLWVDELHTSWTLSGSFWDIAHRARAGNQSPLYFWLLFLPTRTLSHIPGMPIEVILRIPAIVSWCAAIIVCLRLGYNLSRKALASGSPAPGKPAANARRRMAWPVRHDRLFCDLGYCAPLLFIWAWITLDRIQLFYATEARVFGCVQLLNLLAWSCIGHIWLREQRGAAGQRHTTDDRSQRSLQATICVWGGLSILLIHLHITAMLAVVWQIALGFAITFRSNRDLRRTWYLSVFAVLALGGCGLLSAAPVWQHRQQWQSFAGEATLDSLIHLFPLAALAIPILLARVLDSILARSTHRTSELPQANPRETIARPALHAWGWLWLIAVCGPWLMAWCVTACGIAPIFHRRYVIVSALPLVMLAAVELARINSTALRWFAGIGVVVWLVISQGTLANWRAGQWIGWQRVEGWREATAWIESNYHPGDELWCASGLIEGQNADVPLEPELDAYLSFPLRGAYAVHDSAGRMVVPRALVGSSQLWPLQIEQASPLDAKPGEAARTLWIVFRGRLPALEEYLQLTNAALRSRGLSVHVDTVKAFGVVSVARLQVASDE